MHRPEENNYYKEMMRIAIEDRLNDPKPKIVHLHIEHDDDCGYWKRKACDCKPTIRKGKDEYV